MNISSLGQFDAVFGSMILHHIEPFSQFAGILFQTLTPGGKAFFWENNAHSRLLVWWRENLVGRFGIPKHGDQDEFPLTPDELDELQARFQVRVEYPELFLFRLISIYLLRGSGIPSFFTCERGVNRGMRPQVLLNRDSDVEQYGWRTAPRFFTVSRCPDLSGQCSG
jgi:hypothetical protein